MGQKQNYKIKISNYKNIILSLQSALNAALEFFSLKTRERFWGIVYDSVTKQPLDPVIVKLLYADGREAETCVTDLGGRYGFLAAPGKFKLFARKSNYNFPSKFSPAGQDGIYANLYHGEFFSLKDGSEVVAPNIPMDPASFDWNQQAKQKLTKTHPYLKLFFKKLMAVFFWFGFALDLVFLWHLYPKIPIGLYVASAAYLLLLIFAVYVPEPRLWGFLNIKNGRPDDLLLELYNSQFPSVSFGKARVHENGKFLLRAGKGGYLLSVSRLAKNSEKISLGQLKVRIGKNGVLNSTITLVAN